MTITDAIPRLLKLDGLVLPDGRVFHVNYVGNGLMGHMTPAPCPAGLSTMHGPCGAFAFLLMDVVEAIHPMIRFELAAFNGRHFYGDYAGVDDPAWESDCPTRIEAVLETAVLVMEAYAESQKEASE